MAASSSEEWREIVKPLLTGINRYNPEIVETLEKYVQFQSEGESYDFEANLALLKLYQFSPTCINRDIATLILLKALTQLPKTDFIVLKCVLAQSLQVDPSIQSVVELHTQLECCQFKSFWLGVQDVMETVNQVAKFQEAIRNYICSVVDISYQNVPYSMLQDYLGDLDKESTATLIAKNGWSIQEEEGVSIVVIRNQEATIRPKKILAKIEFDSVTGILGVAAGR